MFNKFERPRKTYSWRKFRSDLLGLSIGIGFSLLILWLIHVVFEDSFDWSLGMSGLYVFVIGPFLIAWVIGKCRHPDDRDGNFALKLLKFYISRILPRF